MLSLTTLILFSTASLLLAVTPGPDILYVITRGIGQGRRAAFLAAAGFSTGVIVHTTFAVIGLSALIRASALAFQLVKYAGALYLVYLGVKALIGKSQLVLQEQQSSQKQLTIYWQSVVANVLNPKVALFFLAFLPQFVDLAHGNVVLQMLLLGSIFMVITLLTFSLVGYCAGSVGQWLQKQPGLADKLRYVMGSVFIGLGISVAWPEHH
jgi:threonine/homoserine/homoserine lactone efflux protein